MRGELQRDGRNHIVLSISGSASGTAATLTLSGAATGSTTTSSTGSYTFTGLANGSYTVTPTKSGYTSTLPSAPVTVSGAAITGVSFTATEVPVSHSVTPSTPSEHCRHNLYPGNTFRRSLHASWLHRGNIVRGRQRLLRSDLLLLATSVDGSNNESAYSSQATAVVSTP